MTSSAAAGPSALPEAYQSDFISQLTAEEKLLIIVGSAGAVLLLVLLVVCLVGEVCPLHGLIYKDAGTHGNRSGSQRSSQILGHASRSQSRDDLDTPRPLKKRPERTGLLDGISLYSRGRDSTYSSMSDSGRHSPTSTRSSRKGSQLSLPTEAILGSSKLGQLTFSLQYQTNGERQIGKLQINVQDASDLPSRDYVGTCDPFVRVTLLREKRSLRGARCTVVCEFLTRTHRHAKNPSFKQAFGAEIVKTELKDCVLKLTVYDEDRYGSPTEIGSVTQPLRALKKLLTSEAVQLISESIRPSSKTYGELLFGLSYLPTAQRLTLTLARATNLVTSRVTEDDQQFCPYVRAFLLSGSGRVIKKKKTTAQQGSAAPIFDETVVFDLPFTQLEAVTLLVCLFHRPADSTLTSSGSGEYVPEQRVAEPRSAPSKKDLCVGKVAVGRHVRGDTAVTHWVSMMQSPRQTVSQWHCLK
ncbi:synaptotagmin-5-like isoform X2 [Pollicipes pollicipes]|uniref:synaptotagmin-5-like isoform X2 n=1 Tax=Pollicipes pollicipes TaxID=41117 RepID=UPI001884AF6C|nr:synaptotagmin-5-like isoform X2 [Pollicipes pollicipes]